MPVQRQRPPGALFVEKHLALAHKSLWRAAMEADNWKLQTTAEDIWAILDELRRIHDTVLKRRL